MCGFPIFLPSPTSQPPTQLFLATSCVVEKVSAVKRSRGFLQSCAQEAHGTWPAKAERTPPMVAQRTRPHVVRSCAAEALAAAWRCTGCFLPSPETFFSEAGGFPTNFSFGAGFPEEVWDCSLPVALAPSEKARFSSLVSFWPELCSQALASAPPLACVPWVDLLWRAIP